MFEIAATADQKPAGAQRSSTETAPLVWFDWQLISNARRQRCHHDPKSHHRLTLKRQLPVSPSTGPLWERPKRLNGGKRTRGGMTRQRRLSCCPGRSLQPSSRTVRGGVSEASWGRRSFTRASHQLSPPAHRWMGPVTRAGPRRDLTGQERERKEGAQERKEDGGRRGGG